MRVGLFGTKATSVDLALAVAEKVDELVFITLDSSLRQAGAIAGAADNLELLNSRNNVKVREVSNYSLTNYQLIAELADLKLDIGLAYGWQRLLPGRVLECFAQGVFGWHGSPFRFPYGRGRSPINWAIRLGQPSFFHYLFRFSDKADSGPVVSVREIPILSSDYIEDLIAKAHKNAIESALTLIKRATSETLVALQPQPSHCELWLPKLSPKDSLLEPDLMTVEEAILIVRASSKPFHGSKIHFPSDNGIGRTLLVWRATPNSENEELTEGDSVKKRISFVDGAITLEDFEETQG